MRMPATWIAACVALFAAVATMSAARAEPGLGVADGEYASAEGAPVRYLTLGLPTHDETGLITNAVLVLPDARLTLRDLLSEPFAGALFAPGQSLDPRRYFIVIAHPASVETAYALVLDHLGINHLRLVLGAGSGCDHGWSIAQRYPYFLDAIVAFDCMPDASGNLRAIRSEAVAVLAERDGCSHSLDRLSAMRDARCMQVSGQEDSFGAPERWRVIIPELLEQSEH